MIDRFSVLSIKIGKSLLGACDISCELSASDRDDLGPVLLIGYIWIADDEVERLECIDHDEVLHDLPVVLGWYASLDPVFDCVFWLWSLDLDCSSDHSLAIADHSIWRYTQPLKALYESDLFDDHSLFSIESLDDGLDEMASLHSTALVGLLEWGDLLSDHLIDEIESSVFFRTHHG